MTQKRYLITSALPYINGIKHLGNLVGSLLPADIYARYLRQRGEEVLFICGTDDHGAPAEIAAHQADQTVEDFCEQMYQTQKQIYTAFNLSFDHFGRTASKSNTMLSQHIFKALDDQGYILEKPIQQYYSIEDARFLPDRFITGTCPHCGYGKARGDQCDGCNTLLNPTELESPKSSLNPEANLELRTSNHLFIDLPALQPLVKDWSDRLDNPSKLVAGLLRKWLSEDLAQRCISRDLGWGIPIPKAGYEDKVFYVWFDAPNGYISISQDWAELTGEPDAWKAWWQQPSQVEYTQFMAKDNVPFHAVFWPAMMLGTKQQWTMVNHLKAFSWLTYEGGKFSTSEQRGVFTDTALELFPADYWRYYLMTHAPESSDSDFSFAAFAESINHDLADSLGNFAARILTLVSKYFDGKVPAHQNNLELHQKCQSLCQALDQAHRELRFREITNQMSALWSLGNEYVTQQQPWKLAKEDLVKAGQVLSDCLHLLRLYAITASAVIPTIAEKLMSLLNLNEAVDQIAITDATDFVCIPAGHSVAEKQVLFTKIDDEKVAELTARFSGK